MDDDPALGALFEDHGPARVEVRCRALFAGDVRAESECGPGKISVRMNAEVVVHFGFEAAVGLEETLLSAGAILGPIVVLEGSQVEVSQIFVRRVIRFDLGKVEGFPRRHNLGHQGA